jgi:hypothetical protein
MKTQFTGLANKFKAQVIERRPGHPDEGKVVYETDFAPNLILMNGMDRIATTKLCDLFLYCAIGTDSTPTSRSSGGIYLNFIWDFTGPGSGITLTAASSFFTSGDIGSLIYFDSTHHGIINAVASGTQASIATPVGYDPGYDIVSSTNVLIHKVTQAGLVAEVRRSNNYLTGSGNCGYSRVGDTYTHQRTYDFPVESSPISYNEVGFSHSSTVAGNLNMRGIFSGAPVTLAAGQQLRVIYYFLVTVSPTTARAKNAPVSGWPALQHSVVANASTDRITLVAHGFSANTQISFEGVTPPGGLTFHTTYYVIPYDADHFQVAATSGGGAIDITSAGSSVYLLTNTNGQESLLSEAFSCVGTDGSTAAIASGSGSLVNEPYGLGTNARGWVSTDTSALPSWPSSAAFGAYMGKALTVAAYNSGDLALSASLTFTPSEANSDAIRKVFLSNGSPPITVGTDYGTCFLFDQPQQKSNLFSLTLSWKYTWDWLFS